MIVPAVQSRTAGAQGLNSGARASAMRGRVVVIFQGRVVALLDFLVFLLFSSLFVVR